MWSVTISTTRDEVRERREKGNEAGEGGGRVLSAAASLPTKPKFTFGEYGLWGDWLLQTARGRFCNTRNSSTAEPWMSRLVVRPLWSLEH